VIDRKCDMKKSDLLWMICGCCGVRVEETYEYVRHGGRRSERLGEPHPFSISLQILVRVIPLEIRNDNYIIIT